MSLNSIWNLILTKNISETSMNLLKKTLASRPNNYVIILLVFNSFLNIFIFRFANWSL